MEQAQTKKTVFMTMVKVLMFAYVVTGVLLLLLALLLYKADISEQTVSIGIMAIYVIASFAGGFVMGKCRKTRRFMWGLAEGVAYFVVLTSISLVVNREIAASVSGFVTTLLMCAASGMAGGMLS